MPKLAAFPKAWLDDLGDGGSMTVAEWIEMAAELDVDGMEFYTEWRELKDESNWPEFRAMVEDQGRTVCMLCFSPDFTHPDPAFRKQEIDRQKHGIDMAQALGATYCRTLSGQRRPDVSREDGIKYSVEGIEACLPYAAKRGVILNIENHYKDGAWRYPEFAQHMDVFCDLIAQIDHPNFGINYDPSNTILAGEDPLEILARIKHRVVTMHASDRYLAEGTIEDLRKDELDSVGYAERLNHGEVGKGANDYDAIFSELKSVGFDGWISLEDGMDGLDQMHRSVDFLKAKIAKHWG